MGARLSKPIEPRCRCSEITREDKACQVQIPVTKEPVYSNFAVMKPRQLPEVEEDCNPSTTSIYPNYEYNIEEKISAADRPEIVAPRRQFLSLDATLEISDVSRVPLTSRGDTPTQISSRPMDDCLLKRRFWIPTAHMHVFADQRDRRMESIARMSNCKITLTTQLKKNLVGEVGRIAVINASSKMGLERCTNLLAEKFPAFQLELR